VQSQEREHFEIFMPSLRALFDPAHDDRYHLTRPDAI
jgi:hypothetical protein